MSRLDRLLMRYWLTHSTAVPLREQVATQIFLGIASGELAPGARLPSTRALARRFKVHANTVSSAYRQLEREGRVQLRKGSGVFVCEPSLFHPRPSAIDGLLDALLAQARLEGVAVGTLADRLHAAAAECRADHVLLLEPDPELRAIALAELRGALTLPVEGPECTAAGTLAEIPSARAIVVVFPSRTALFAAMLPPGTSVFRLTLRSVPESLAQWLPASAGVLVGVVSRWPRFLEIAQVMLASAGVPPSAALLRDAREGGWSRGLKACAGVVCDAAVESAVPAGIRTIPFRLIADASIEELRARQSTHGAR